MCRANKLGVKIEGKQDIAHGDSVKKINYLYMNCKICNQNTSEIFKTMVLKKHDVSYYQCSSCKFVQTSEVHWLQEAYENAITSLDIGLINRNLYLQEQIPPIINHCFSNAKTMLDFGGGYGIFVRMMRDKGYDFYRQDIYCDNLFAKHFDILDWPDKKIDVVTAFEVFEHLENPLEEIGKMLSYSGNIIFSTTLLPSDISTFKDWWYVSPETGQHIAFYSEKSLRFIANKSNLHFYTNHNNLHFFSKEKVDQSVVNKVFFPKKSIVDKVIDRFISNPPTQSSLLQVDYNYILKKISN